MWQDRLKELLYILENSDANEIDVTFLGRRYRVVKEPPIIEDNALKTSLKPKQTFQQVDSPKSIEGVSEEDNGQIDGSEVLSPMPGTFFRSPSPEDESFVEEGDTVKKGDTLCIIEAMKIMNEIEAEDNGVIQKILVEVGQAVEFNQPLFIIEPN